MDVVKLIRGVKARQPLWDRKHAYYHDRSVTMVLWDDVAARLGADPDSVRLKWKGLRDTFRGELKKVHKGLMNGKQKTSTNWEYFDEMLFVKEQIYSTKHLNDIVKPINSASDESKSQIKTEYETSEASEEKVIFKNLQDEQEITNHYSSANIEEDDDYNFLMSILPQLRCLPTTRNLYIRLKIQELLYNEIMALQAI
ncbi:transcription factor Adf-1-like [Cimex lectularius]|uniref:Transcription factor Adf-1 n=1 Tax=Cimex lectularius TaxID=79782 RepID=A0A8I6RY22_CIMLE|nr:transcription factor Adf-1-like [Cimex lectularius]